MTFMIPELLMQGVFGGANDDTNQDATQEPAIALGLAAAHTVSLTRVLRLRCTLRDRINRWAERSRSAMVLFEGNTQTAAMYFMNELKSEAGASNAASQFDTTVPWGGGPVVRRSMVVQMLPRVVSEALKMDGDFHENFQVLLTDGLHETFEEIVHDIETIRTGLIQRVSDAGGNLVLLGHVVERVDGLSAPEVPTEAEIVRDLFLGYAYSRRMHIQGDRNNFSRSGNFYRSMELCDAGGVHAQSICALLNRLPDVELPGSRGPLLEPIEFHAPG